MKQQLKRSKRDTPRGTLQRLKYSIRKLHIGEGTNYGQPISKVSHWKASLDFNNVRQQLDMEWIHTDGILIVDTVQMPNTADAIKVLERACTKRQIRWAKDALNLEAKEINFTEIPYR